MSKEAPAIADPLSGDDSSSSSNNNNIGGNNIAAIANDTLHKKNNHHHTTTPPLLRPVRRLRPLVYILPYLVGIAWTALHPLLSVVTGESKCRGAYIDENGLDVHRYRIPNYPTSRIDFITSSSYSSSTLVLEDDNDDTESGKGRTITNEYSNNYYGMCHALRKLRPSFVDCLTHVATTKTILSNDDNTNRQQQKQQQQQQRRMIVSFDIVRIIPTLGPMKDMTEAIVLVVGGSSRCSNRNASTSSSTHKEDKTCNNDDNTNDDDDDDDDGKWYNNNDMNASIIRLISRLSNSNDCPWLNKVIYIVSPNNDNDDNVHLGDVVDAFLSSHSGDDTNANRHTSKNRNDDYDYDTPTTMLLPLDYTHPIIRSLIVINDVHDDDIESTATATATTTKSKVKILPQAGINNGILPNLDLVFATTMSFQSQPANSKDGQWDRSKSLYYSGIGSSSSSENNEQREPHFTAHPNYYGSTTTTTTTTMIEKYTCKIMHYVFVTILKYDSTKLDQYINDMFGMLYFLISMIIGP